jgi:hypothetical protein
MGLIKPDVVIGERPDQPHFAPLAGTALLFICRYRRDDPVLNGGSSWPGASWSSPVCRDRLCGLDRQCAVGTATLGIILFGEPATAFRLASIGLIVAGIAGLKFVT